MNAVFPPGTDVAKILRIVGKVKTGQTVTPEEEQYVNRSIPLPVYQGCGDCTACCTLQGVKELGKPYYTHCQHEGKGCNIYGKHPESCKHYSCFWNIGEWGGPENRPDRLGVMFGLTPSWNQFWIEAMEVWPQDMLSVLRKWMPEFRKQLVRTDDEFPMGGIIYVPFGMRVGVPFPIQAPYPDGTTNKGTTFRKLWGSDINIRVYNGTQSENEEQAAKSVSLATMLSGVPTSEEVKHFWRHNDFHSISSLAIAIGRHLMSDFQRKRLNGMGVTVVQILNGQIRPEQEQTVAAILADWNDKLEFVNFFCV